MYFTHKQGSAEYLILALPNEAEYITLETNQSTIPYSQMLQFINGNFRGLPNSETVDIPPNNYEIMYSGLLDEVSEDVARKIVRLYLGKHFRYYRNYLDPIHRVSSAACTPIESFLSLIRSKGWLTENPHGSEPFNNDMYYPASMKIMQRIKDDWQESQQKVVNKIAILKIV